MGSVLMLAEGVLIQRPRGSHSGVGYQTLPVSARGQPVWSYEVLHCLWLPLLGLGVHGRTKLCNKADFHQHLAQSSRAGQQKAQGTPRSAAASRLPGRLNHWKTLWWYSLCIRKALSESPDGGKCCSPD